MVGGGGVRGGGLSVDYDSTDVAASLDIHKYFMAKNNIKNVLAF